MSEWFAVTLLIIFAVIAIYSFFKMISIHHDFLTLLRENYPALNELNFPITWKGEIFSKVPFKERLVRGGGLYSSIGLSIFFPIASTENSKEELLVMRSDKVYLGLRRKMLVNIIPSLFIYLLILCGLILEFVSIISKFFQ